MAAVMSCENALSSQEKLKTMVTQNFKRTKRLLRYFLKWPLGFSYTSSKKVQYLTVAANHCIYLLTAFL